MFETVKEIYKSLIAARKPYDFFGDVNTKEELKKLFHNITKRIHPDSIHNKEDYYMSCEASPILNKLYMEAKKEMDEGIYGVIDPVKIYEKMSPLFSLKVKGKEYQFYENLFDGEVSDIYRGICDGMLSYLKLASDKENNGLLAQEFDILSKFPHQLLPYAEAKIKVNDRQAIIMHEVQGVPMEDIMSKYPAGIPAEHVMWMLERLLNVAGWLHSNKIVHGNIKPENIIIDPATHRVTLLGLSFAIKDANTKEARYKIVNDFYTAPEVNKDAHVMPGSDIYSIGKVAIKMLGGNVSNKGMPVNVDVRIRDFIRNMCDDDTGKRPNDAWELWSSLISLRTEIYGKRRFQSLEI